MSFQRIPEDVFKHHLIPFLGPNQVGIGRTSKRFRELMETELRRRKQNAERIHQWIDASVIELFGSCASLAFWPQLQWKNEFQGGTGYIDRIVRADVSAPIQWGTSACGRAFITLRTNRGVVVLFQRYSRERNTWAVGDGDRTNLFRCPGYFVNRGRLSSPLFGINLYNLLVGCPKHFTRNWKDELRTSNVVLV